MPATPEPNLAAGQWSLRFDGGTLVLDGADPEDLPEGFVWDARIGRARAPGSCWRSLYEAAAGQAFEDRARGWTRLDSLRHLTSRPARRYQDEAVDAWRKAGRRGVVVLPTGSGKTYVAERCIADTRRSTLVVVPTIDLLSQWYALLHAAFGVPVGILGGGHHEIEELTVTTYDSAAIHMDRLGARFGLVVFDEVHHLPAPGYLRASQAMLAPMRLGLTATLERLDQRHDLLDDAVGPVVYRQEIPDLAGDYLAPYDVEVLNVSLSDAERLRYDQLRGQFRSFVDHNRIRLGGPDGWQLFLSVACRSKDGRAAIRAWRDSREIMWSNERKLELVQEIVTAEWGRPTLIFTNDNATALRISKLVLAPCITHRTELKERRAYIEAFATGELKVLVTSRVLNEGVDLPAAEVAIIVSGTSTVRESVQRLGRILRPGPNKQATLYELVAENTTEVQSSERRRSHDAYR